MLEVDSELKIGFAILDTLIRCVKADSNSASELFGGGGGYHLSDQILMLLKARFILFFVFTFVEVIRIKKCIHLQL